MVEVGRAQRRARVLESLDRLRRDFPLEERIKRAQPAVQAVYAQVILHWVRHGMPPRADIAPLAVLDELTAMDALVIGESGIGCYPFSARKTGIRVQYSGSPVYAMCAIDALAIPRLVRRPVRIEARCTVCRCRLACDLEANGALPHDFDRGIRILWEPSASHAGPCCDSLCAGITFICRYCSVPGESAAFSLPEAAAIGNAFFAFQHKLLEHYGPL